MADNNNNNNTQIEEHTHDILSLYLSVNRILCLCREKDEGLPKPQC